MRIKTIQLTWFRGAARPVDLDMACKSLVVYGANASGKSSFVDALEFALNEGRISHLAHEYSGRKLENSVPNTHKAAGTRCGFAIAFCNGAEFKVEIGDDGSVTYSGSMSGWDYRRTVLRQEEVVEFIRDTKGGKYSALLPLFGLQEMEIAAENLRQLARNVATHSGLESTRVTVAQLKSKRSSVFGSDSDDGIITKLKALHGAHCPGEPTPAEGLALCSDLITSFEKRIEQYTAEQRRHAALADLANVKFESDVATIRRANGALASEADPLVSEKLAVLQAVEPFAKKLPEGREIHCPACGRSVPAIQFRTHVAEEMLRLSEIRNTFTARAVAMANISDSVKILKGSLGKPDLKVWKEELSKLVPPDHIQYLDSVDADRVRARCEETDLLQIETKLQTIVDAAAGGSSQALPDIRDLIKDKAIVEAANEILKGASQFVRLGEAEALIRMIQGLEKLTRDQIRLRAGAVIGEISDDIKNMWSILHPGEAIQDVHLYVPKETDKAIDIGLMFHGKEQNSPRLTLSEGYRNSLGLCIFLAMAKREAKADRPVILDDVVISLDRNHRGMIVELLAKEFGGRQVLVLTHDRDWFVELRQHLAGGDWGFKVLMPYEGPEVGIRWSDRGTAFDDARAQLKDRPDSAGADARKIMDVELSVAAKALHLKLPYLRFDKNDRRTAHEFIERLVADGPRCLQKRNGAGFGPYPEALEAMKLADRLLITWANHAAHSFDVVRPEATKLIDACEGALRSLYCPSCRKPVWLTEDSGHDLVQCHCGTLRWRYGKV